MNKKTLVIGASLKPERYSNVVIHRLLNNNHEVRALGMRKGEVSGVEIDTDILQYKNIDTVTLYLSPERQEAYFYYIISLSPKRVIFNPGTENSAFYPLLDKHNISYEEACTLVLLSTNQY